MQHQNLFIFDIETIPDVDSGANLLDMKDSSKEEIREAMSKYHLDITDGRSDFLRQPFHKIVAISFVECEIVRDFDGGEFYRIVDVRSGGDLMADEADLVRGFFGHLKKKLSRLVSFNGRSFDLPVLKYRAMKHGVECGWLYKNGDKWNNYNQRYSLDWHCDLAEAFSDFGASARVKMNELCSVFNLPGKIGVDGSKVSEMYDNNQLKEIRDYCETDVLNTYLLYLFYQHHTGTLKSDAFKKSIDEMKKFLEGLSKERAHFGEFLKEWERL
ncbi:MAG: 3'-5' exonuclease [Rickettsiales bacterium]|nr:3'-5' exonuclease [Rickettsiales bacterium]